MHLNALMLQPASRQLFAFVPPCSNLVKDAQLGRHHYGDVLQVVALITIEVHARDVIDKLSKAGVTSPAAFEWSSQLRFYWDQDNNDCFVKQVSLFLGLPHSAIGTGLANVNELTGMGICKVKGRMS